MPPFSWAGDFSTEVRCIPFFLLSLQPGFPVTGRFPFLLAPSEVTCGPPRAFNRRHTAFLVTPVSACRRLKGKRRLHMRRDTQSSDSQKCCMVEYPPPRLWAVWRHVAAAAAAAAVKCEFALLPFSCAGDFSTEVRWIPSFLLPFQPGCLVTGRFLFLRALPGVTCGPPRAFNRRHTAFLVTPVSACRRLKDKRRLHMRRDTQSGDSQKCCMVECSPSRLTAF